MFIFRAAFNTQACLLAFTLESYLPLVSYKTYLLDYTNNLLFRIMNRYVIFGKDIRDNFPSREYATLRSDWRMKSSLKSLLQISS